MLRLSAFGPVTVRREAPPEAGPAGSAELLLQRRPLALLCLLAAAGEGGLSRDKLLAFLWPESDEEHARNTLRQALHTLRRTTGEPDLLLGNDVLRLNAALIGSDVGDIEAALRAGALDRAAAVYTGPFLDGFHVGNAPEFDRWADAKRLEYATRVGTAIEALAVAAADPGAAVRWWRRLAELDPLAPKPAAGLMRALVKAGNPAAALQHARVYEALLREELGAAPDPTVVELVAAITSGAARASPGLPATASDTRPSAAPESPTPLLTGLQRGLSDRYDVLDALPVSHAGRADRAFRARDLRHDRPVVLRVLHGAVASALDLERFLREIRLSAKLQHPHILPLLDSGALDGRPWYTTPSTEGESLRERLTREHRIAATDAVRITREIAQALDHAHRNGVVHRDVAPENILLVGGSALLTSLGVARAIDAAGGVALTETGVIVGSPAYMSPEQAAGEREIDGRSDLYSLGCVLYEMLAGEPLYSGPTPQAIMAKRAHPLELPAELLEDAPAAVRASLRRALAWNPDARFPSAAALSQGLTDEPAATDAIPARRPFSRLVVVAVAILLAVLVALILLPRA
jgi:DNA-binding SARP family transcriptional activator